MVNAIKAIILLGILAAGSIFAASDNLIAQYGGFEEGRTGWTLSVNGDGDDSGRVAAAAYEIDSTSGDGVEGTKYYRLNVTAVTSENWHVQLKDPTWEAKIGYIYHFSFWARADAERKSQISVIGSAESRDEYRTSSPITLTTEWKQYHQMFTADAEGPGQHSFSIVCGFETGVFEFDGASITEGVPSDNIYSNGSFEADGAGWSLYINDGETSTAAATMSFPEGDAPDGSKFCRIEVTAISVETTESTDTVEATDSTETTISTSVQKPINWHVQLQDAAWMVDSGWEYSYSFYGRADAPVSVHLCAQAGASREWEYISGIDCALTEEWQKFEFSYTAVMTGSDSLSFNIYCGVAVGIIDIDNIVLSGYDTKVQPFAGQAPRKASSFVVKLLPERLQVQPSAMMISPCKVTLHDIQGRLFLSRMVETDGRSFNLPRPASGTWIVRLNSGESRVVTVP
jgi:hypothetical protein